MKKNTVIIALWIIALIGAFSLKSNAQLVQKLEYPSDISITNDRSELLADETTITDTKTGAKIECSNDKVHFKLYEKWQHTFIRYSWKWKKDRHGAYKEYSITVSKKDGDLIKEWAKTNL